MTLNDLSVIVAGGGIGGLSAALLLGRSGARVTLVERVTDPAEVGAGLLLQPNGLAVLHALGLGDQLVRTGVLGQQGALRTARGTVLSQIVSPDYGPGLDQLVAIRRSTLYTALLAAVRAEPAITRQFGTVVVDAGRSGRLTVAATADPAETWELTADLVIGADGIGSVVRGAGSFDADVTRTGHRYLRAIVPGDDTTGAELSGEYWTALGLFGGSRVDSEHLYFYADVTATEVDAAVRARDVAGLRREWSRVLPLAGRLLSRVADFDELLLNEVSTVRCRRWHDGRLVLLGDAAHAMAPTAGQGANSALVDAAVLTLELADRPVDLALERYDRRRRPAVTKVQRRSTQLARLAAIRGPVGRALRDAGLGLLGRLSGGSDRMARSLQQEDPAALRLALQQLSARSEGQPR